MIDKLIELYGHSNSEEVFHLSVTGRQADSVVARKYLKKYHLSEEEYMRVWKPIQDLIFVNQNKGLPSMVFRSSFSLSAIYGGVLFVESDFERLRSSLRLLGDQHIIIIQNDFGGDLKFTPLRMKYPSDITWEELMSGNFISVALFEMFANEYFVFSESGKWGKYSANDYEQPLDIIGFKPDYEPVFRKSFEQLPQEWTKIKEWLPPKYKEVIK